MRSPWAGAPALMASAPNPTEKSDNQSSFVSPDLWLAIVPHPAEEADLTAPSLMLKCPPGLP
jgi:hypothetical protein